MPTKKSKSSKKSTGRVKHLSAAHKAKISQSVKKALRAKKLKKSSKKK